MTADVIETISAAPLFRGLPRNQLQDLGHILMDRTWNRGETVFSEGDAGDGFYLLVTGRVKIFKVSSEGREQILQILGPGEPFGEVPVFSGQHFPAHARTMEASRILFFPRKAFVALLGRNPSMSLNMLAVLSRRLRRFTMLIDDLSLKAVPGRLSAYLLYLSEKENHANNLRLTITKGQLAGLLGTIPETLSRILGKMAKQKLIASEGTLIRILDRKGLEDLAESGGHL